MLLGGLAPAFAVPAPLRGADVMGVVRGAGGEAAEIFRFAPEIAPALIRSGVDDVLSIDSWPISPGQRGAVTLSRREVYAPDAVIYRVDATGTHEVPRSTLRFYAGAADADAAVRVFVQIDPDTGEMQGLTLTPEGAYDVRRATNLARSSPADEYVLARADVLDAGDTAKAWSCSEEDLPQLPGWMGGSSPAVASASSAVPVAPAVFSSPHYAVVAVDTDNELLFTKFGDSTVAAVNYIASLMAQMSVIYERDLLVQLVQGTTFLRLGDPADGNRFNDDPWTQTSSGAATVGQLSELTNYWAANYSGFQRTVTAMLSGKGTSGASGIAWVPGALCSSSSNASFTQVFRTGTSVQFGDVLVVGHEIGHNFGSPHTHCYSPPIDTCYNAQSGCYSGATSCPAPQTINGVTNVRGTLMSYCHNLGSCSSSLVFHQRTVDLISTLLSSAGACVSPGFQVTSVAPSNGPTAGGQGVTIRGGFFVAGATVTVGGVPATNVVVVNNSTITATTPAHAAGSVAVAVSIPGPQTATRSNSYLYADPGAAKDFYTLTPCRVLDTRSANGPLGGPILTPTLSRVFTLAGVCGIPAGAAAVSLNVTVVTPAAAGQLSLFPGNAFSFSTNSLSFKAGVTRANNVIMELATDGSGSIGVENASPGGVHVIVDVNGYFQ